MARTAWNKGIAKYKPKLCICGCGELVKLHKYSKNSGGFTYLTNKFIKGHEKRGISGFNPKIHTPQSCACGCGQYTNKFRGKFLWCPQILLVGKNRNPREVYFTFTLQALFP